MPTRPTNVDWNVYSSGEKAVAVTPSDATVLEASKGLYIGGSGNVAVTMKDGTSVTFTGISAGMIHPISVTKVKATGTTATNIVAVY